MATPLGGNAPKPKKKGIDLLVLGIGGKKPGGMPGSSMRPEPPPAESNEPDKANEPAQPQGAIKPGKAMFNSQDEVCSKCEYFDQAGKGGVGECKMGVPEADFSKADPDASHCIFFEANDDATEIPAQEASEHEPMEMPA